MARTSTRNFQVGFRAIAVDDAASGPEVSQDVQLVYIADDLRQATYIDGGTGGTEAARVGEHGFITLQCRTPRGLEVMQVTMTNQVPAFGNFLHVWTSAVIPTVVGPANMLSALRTVGREGFPQSPQSQAQQATILTAQLATGAFRYVDVQGFTGPFFINNGQFFNVAFSVANTAVDLGIRWRELRLYP